MCVSESASERDTIKGLPTPPSSSPKGALLKQTYKISSNIRILKETYKISSNMCAWNEGQVWCSVLQCATVCGSVW